MLVIILNEAFCSILAKMENGIFLGSESGDVSLNTAAHQEARAVESEDQVGRCW